jgi:hypothetical protein
VPAVPPEALAGEPPDAPSLGAPWPPLVHAALSSAEQAASAHVAFRTLRMSESNSGHNGFASAARVLSSARASERVSDLDHSGGFVLGSR